MTITWLDVVASFVWAAGLGIVFASAVIWRMERQRRKDDEAFLKSIREEAMR